MAYLRLTSFRPNDELMSGILNLVCPQCGGSMWGGRGAEFKCGGECRRDWREVWAQMRSRRRSRRYL